MTFSLKLRTLIRKSDGPTVKIISDNVSTTTEIDSFNFNILTNFIVIINDTNINLFYFKLIKDAEKLFMSTFSFNTNSWSSPCQITNSKNRKIYLSAIKSIKDNTYHIAYSENINNQYYCTYINGYTKTELQVFLHLIIHLKYWVSNIFIFKLIRREYFWLNY